MTSPCLQEQRPNASVIRGWTVEPSSSCLPIATPASCADGRPKNVECDIRQTGTVGDNHTEYAVAGDEDDRNRDNG